MLVLWDGRLIADVSTASLLTERVAELAVVSRSRDRIAWLLDRFPGTVLTATGVAVPLARGLTLQHVLAACREERIGVGGSRVRPRALEDLMASAERGTDT